MPNTENDFSAENDLSAEGDPAVIVTETNGRDVYRSGDARAKVIPLATSRTEVKLFYNDVCARSRTYRSRADAAAVAEWWCLTDLSAKSGLPRWAEIENAAL